MFKALKTKLTILTVVSLMLLTVASPLVVAQSKADVCAGVGVVTGTGCTPAAGSPTVNSIIATVINILSFIIGVAAVVMIMIGGFKYITANGDSSSISSAKSTILYAIVGLIFVASAQVIVQFVLSNV